MNLQEVKGKLYSILELLTENNRMLYEYFEELDGGIQMTTKIGEQKGRLGLSGEIDDRLDDILSKCQENNNYVVRIRKSVNAPVIDTPSDYPVETVVSRDKRSEWPKYSHGGNIEGVDKAADSWK